MATLVTDFFVETLITGLVDGFEDGELLDSLTGLFGSISDVFAGQLSDSIVAMMSGAAGEGVW
jgi:hypothetical protein